MLYTCTLIIQLWKQFDAVVPGDLPDETRLEETWKTFLAKIEHKANIESGKTKLDVLKKTRDEELKVYMRMKNHVCYNSIIPCSIDKFILVPYLNRLPYFPH